MMVVGHRGAAGLVPENTIPSWERAIALGCDFIECDVRVTRDGELVIMHDAKIDRTTSGTGAVAELTLVEIRAVDAGNGERVPTLSEFLDLVERHRVQALVEMKAEEAIAPSVAEVGRRKLWPWVFITSGKADWVAQVKGLDSQGRTGVAYSNPSLDDLKRAADIGAAGVGIQFPHLT
ncbi:MAG TPA: glycerophosphodiester phosphodiesterase family protein, partial [Limnochordia bacterium]|nr:glycerophosphodiester phosphodiesterase family protein [Limnochordia bacterium]